MKTYYITFGVQYGECMLHPQGMRGDAWAEIQAESELEARKAAFAFFREHWADSYTAETFERGLYPFGCILRIHLVKGHLDT